MTVQMNRMTFMLFLMCLLCATLFADEPADLRLDQKVTIKAIGEPLGDLVIDLSAKTGVRITARKDVADVKFAVYAHDLTLADLLDGIEYGLHGHCSKYGKDPDWEYEFWMDMKSKQALNDAQKEERARLRKYMDQLVADLKFTPTDLKNKYKDDPQALFRLEDASGRAILQTYAAMDPSTLDALYRDGDLVEVGDEIPSGMRENLLAAITKEDEEFDKEFAKYEAEYPDPDFPPTEMTKSEDPWTGIETISWHIEGAGLKCDIKPPTLRGPGNSRSSASLTAIFDADIKRKYMGPEAVLRTYDDKNDPLLAKTVTLKLDKKLDLYRLLEQVADQSGGSIIADYSTFIRQFELQQHPDILKAKTLGDMLTALLNNLDCYLTRDQNTYRLTFKPWYKARQREIPKRLVTRWKETITQMGMAGLRTAIEMTDLTDEQLDDLELYGLGGKDRVKNSRELLGFLGSFSDQQWEQAGSKAGLSPRNLDAKERQLLLAWAGTERMRTRASRVPDDIDYQPTLDDIASVSISSYDVTYNDLPCEEWRLYLWFRNGAKIDDMFSLPLVQPKDAKKADHN